MNTAKKIIVATALSGSLLLNSCYFNSAGHIFDKASYQASSFTRELKSDKNQVVYTDGSDYYVELTRYRMGKPVVTQYSVFSQDETSDKDKLQVRGKVMFRIPRDFAMYLTGQAKGPDVPSEMTLVKNGAEIKSRCSTLPIVKNAGKYAEVWQHRSSAAPWLYTAGVFDWLCVDLPMTCVENAIVISLGAVMLAFETSSAYGAIERTLDPVKYGDIDTSAIRGDGSSSSSSGPNHYEIRGFYHSQGM